VRPIKSIAEGYKEPVWTRRYRRDYEDLDPREEEYFYRGKKRRRYEKLEKEEGPERPRERVKKRSRPRKSRKNPKYI